VSGTTNYVVKFSSASTVATGSIFDNGNIGIGTTTTSLKLNVSGSIYMAGGNGSAISWASDISSQFLKYDSGIDGMILSSWNNTIFYTQQTERVRINSTGNLGIGTTSPGTKLEVVGSIRGGSFPISTTNTGEAWFGRGSDRALGSYTLQLGGSSAAGTWFEMIDRAWSKVIFAVSGEAPTTSFYLTSTGNVGIGTSSPGVKLDVIGGVRSFSSAGNYGLITNGSFQAVGDHGGTFMLDLDNTGAADLVNIKKSGTSRFYIKNDGNIGIGTTSPATILDVKGNVFVANAANGNNTIAFGNIGTLGPLNGAPDNLTGSAFLVVSSSTASGAPSHMKFFTTTGGVCGERMRIAADGNVGVGSISPAYKLDVSGTARVGDSFLITTATTADARLEIGSGRSGNGNSYLDLVGDATYIDYGLRLIRYDTGANANSRLEHKGTGQLQLFVSEAGSLTISTNSSERMRIASDGNVGIGTSSPGQKLEVSGSVKLTTGGYIYGDTTTPYLRLNQANGTYLAYSTTSVLALLGSVTTLSAGSNYLGLITNGSERFRIDSGGNVGIGTSSPAAGLDVSKATSYVGINGTDTYLYLRGYNTGRTAIITNAGSSGNYNGLAIITNETNANSLPSWRMDIGGYDGISYGTDNFWIGRTPSGGSLSRFLFINNGGNIGIGTTAPNYPIDLQLTTSPLTLNLKLNKASTTNDYAEIAFQLWSGAGSGVNTFGGSGTSRPSVVLRALNENGGSAAGAFVVGTFTGGTDNSTLNERFRITSAGNVGIGTTSPATQLHVSGSLQIGNGSNFGNKFTLYDDFSSGKLAYVMRDLSGDDIFGLYCNSTTGEVRLLADDDNGTAFMTFQMNSSERMRITNGGNVGIGTTSPTAFLDIVGNGIHTILRNTSATSYTSLRLYNDQNSAVRALEIDYSGASYSGALITSGPTGESACVTTTGAYPLAFGTNNTARMTILSGGNVGIGTNVPSSLLHVYKASGDSILTLDNTGNGNTSGINFNRERLTGGAGYNAASIFADSDTSSNNALLYIQAQSTNANAGVTSALTANNGVRLLLRGGTGILSIENGASETFRINANGNVGIGTTSPVAKLDVAGDSKLGSSISNVHQITGSLSITGSVTGISTESFHPFLLG
jgi:hypothetical protein